ncbi:hypothetical protein SS50377_21057 [Spironucleus salmonicida]|uniref:Uncharacterized protein n=1 Tax=Spironucleus salmonicida TaxID=348837 RepID=V6LSH4_9EUKA|nr:hypothetical protein SS50377_21057 [Spironucleus salmonicida]|eukprot:EST43714.1 Hypothetical protein SS50377_16768 [Spironucleus salmonicida]
MMKPQNYFTLLQQLQHRNLRRQFQAQLQPLQNLPDIQDLLMIAVALFPDAFDKKEGVKNIVYVLGKLYRQTSKEISNSITLSMPSTAEFLENISEPSSDNTSGDDVNVSQKTPMKQKSTPKQQIKQNTPKTVTQKNLRQSKVENVNYVQQVFDEIGPGFRTQGFGQQFTDPCLHQILNSYCPTSILPPDQVVNVQLLDNQLIVGDQHQIGSPLFVIDAVVSPLTTVFSAVYYMYQQRKLPSEQIEFLQTFLAKIFYIQFQTGQQILLDCNAFESKSQFITFSENYNSEIRLVQIQGIPTFIIQTVKILQPGDVVSISFESSWVRQDSILVDNNLQSYRIQNLRYDLKCQNMQFQIGILTIQDGKYYQYAFNAAQNSNLRELLKKYCQVKQLDWDEISKKNIFENKELMELVDQRFFYQGKIDETLVVRLCDILGYW